MFLDVVAVILFALAVFKGYSKGLVVAVFSFLSIILGIALAMKFSVLVAEWLAKHTSISSTFLPVLSFVVVLLGVALLVRIGAKLIQKSLQLTLLAWVDKIGGILLYALLYTTLLSVGLFYAVQIRLLDEGSLAESTLYPLVRPFAQWFIDALAFLLPFFKDMFTDLQDWMHQLRTKE